MPRRAVVGATGQQFRLDDWRRRHVDDATEQRLLVAVELALDAVVMHLENLLLGKAVGAVFAVSVVSLRVITLHLGDLGTDHLIHLGGHDDEVATERFWLLETGQAGDSGLRQLEIFTVPHTSSDERVLCDRPDAKPLIV